MTNLELLNSLLEVKKEPDKELAHRNADDLLLRYIDDKAITEIFIEIDKYYS